MSICFVSICHVKSASHKDSALSWGLQNLEQFNFFPKKFKTILIQALATLAKE